MGGSLTPAAQRMDQIYRYQRYIYNVTRRYYLLGRTTLQNELQPPDGGRVLEIGCGTGWNLIRAARAYPDAQFFGVDASAEMLKTAQRSVEQAKLSGQIILAEADATQLHSHALFATGNFDRVFFSYTLSMIPAWRDARRGALPLLGKTGSLHIVDFGQCAGLPKLARSALYRWLEQFDVTPRAGLENELQKLCAASGARLTISHPFRGYTTLARLTQSSSATNGPRA